MNQAITTEIDSEPNPQVRTIWELLNPGLLTCLDPLLRLFTAYQIAEDTRPWMSQQSQLPQIIFLSLFSRLGHMARAIRLIELGPWEVKLLLWQILIQVLHQDRRFHLKLNRPS